MQACFCIARLLVIPLTGLDSCGSAIRMSILILAALALRVIPASERESPSCIFGLKRVFIGLFLCFNFFKNFVRFLRTFWERV